MNMCYGYCVGFVCVLIFECSCGNICGIVVPGCSSIKNIFHARNYVIPWGDIVKIGDDVILVNADLNSCSVLD